MEIKEMTEEEYRAHPAINFSSIASFYNKGVYSPDHALMKFEFKSYFEYGKMFETMLQDALSGTKEFEKRFFVTELANKMPDNLIKWINDGDDLLQYFELKKDGGRSATYKGRHAYLDEALKNPGKIPVSVKDSDMLKRHTSNMLKMEYLGHKVEDILKTTKWQVPIIWTDEIDGLEKKALLDCLVELDGTEYLAIDIKTTAGLDKFGWMLRDRYKLQDLHYVEGVNAKIGHAMQMVFFVASKEAPFLCQPIVADYGGMDFRIAALEEYREICLAYKKWNDAGRFPKGWLPLGTVKCYPKNV